MTNWAWEVDEHGVYTYCSGNVRSILGYRREEVLGKTVFDFMPEAEAQEFRAQFFGAARQRVPAWDAEKVVRSKDGALRRVHTSVFSVLDEAGLPRGFRGVDKDVTAHTTGEVERSRLEAQFRHVQNTPALDMLASGIVHDFNNLLEAVVAYADTRQSALPADSPVLKDTRAIMDAAYRAKELVQQAVTCTGQAEQAHTPVHVHPIVEETVSLLRASLGANIEVRLELDADCGPTVADPTQLHRVVMNLCTNACHAMRAHGGVLTITLGAVELGAREARLGLEGGRYLRLAVSDTGHGMNASTIEQVFEPFFTTKALGEGTGVGLAVVRSIVNSLGGAVTVSSLPDRGTTFEVYLPRSSGPPAAQAQPLAAVRGGGERILFVDDEALLARMAQETLDRLGYSVTAHTNAVEALAAFRAQPDTFDVVVTDHTMPAITGPELIRELMQIRPDVPIILISGLGGTLSTQVIEELGIREVMMKPIDVRELSHAIRQALT